MTPIIAAAQALDGLLRAAEDGDLPMPFTARVDDYPPHGHPHEQRETGGVDLQVHTRADLIAWSTWLDAPIDDSAEPYEGKIHCHVFGYAGPIPVRVTALVPVAEVTA